MGLDVIIVDLIEDMCCKFGDVFCVFGIMCQQVFEFLEGCQVDQGEWVLVEMCWLFGEIWQFGQVLDEIVVEQCKLLMLLYEQVFWMLVNVINELCVYLSWLSFKKVVFKVQ